VRKTDHDEAATGLVSARGSALQSKQHMAALRLAHKNENAPVGLDVIRQTTISTSVSLDGVGLHKGTMVHLVLKPAEPDTGIVFRRTDLDTDDVEVTDIAARYDTVCDATMCTTIGNAAGTTVATIEHIMAAIAALEIDNLIVEIDAHEVPVMDGSSDAFVAMLDRAGRCELPAARRFIRLLDRVSLEDGLKTASLNPHDDGFRVEFSIDFDNPVIGRQSLAVDVSPESFRGDLSNARTFGFIEDYEMLRSLGLAQGATLENAVVLDGDTVMNEDGLRAPDEFVRHKVLDAIGDLSLAGAPILGCYQAARAGHAFNNQMLHALFANPDAWEVVTLRHSQVMPYVAPLAVSAD
jgi:UDP-3-O-[3-hydroxymyristoyl] N-acetylglucosamine deacetylase